MGPSVQQLWQAAKPKAERSWAPRMWIGSDFFAWLRIMARGRFRFHLPHIYIGVCTSLIAFGHSVLQCAQNIIYRRRIRRTPIDKAPIFIIGHWRTGTTLLHELMIQDDRHNFPNTYQCYDPTHFLLTEKYFKKWFWFLLPERRPMDNMRLGWDRPQEDEFALCMLGQPSPYLDIIFPNRPPLTPGALDLQGISARARRAWKRAFYQYVQTLTFKDPRRLVLKSPPHSCRIPTLLELFPDARFIHIVRNPYEVFPSTVNLWRSLAEKHGLQTPHHRDVEKRVFATLPDLYAKLEEGKKLVAPSRFHELRYEDLVRDPIGALSKIYERLELGGFEDVHPKLTQFLARNANYETNKFELPAALRDEITLRWGDVIRHYGYPIASEAQAGAAPLTEEPEILMFPAAATANEPEAETSLEMAPEQARSARRAS
jgi:omega-hydroxy-beta-dihydromenaquinone-9 sulfotransferase